MTNMPNIDTSKLEAVNSMLSLIGEAPVNSLTDNTTEDLALALRILDKVDRMVQGSGWHWNSDEKVVITANSEGKFAWELDWIRFDTPTGKYTGIDVVRRGGFLWDRKNNTNIFTQETLEGEVVRYIAWGDLPESARNYVMIRASRQFLQATVGDEVRAGFAVEDERTSWRLLNEEESDQGDPNIFDTDLVRKVNRPAGGGLRAGLVS